MNARTKAVIAVHLFGLCADIDGLRKAAPGIPIIEDAACAVGAAYHGKSAGTLGDIAAFSFHPRKIITTGEGGMVTTNSSAYADTVGSLRSHGATVSEEQRHGGNQPYLLPEFPHVGFNYRMTDVQAAIGTVQLKRLDKLLDERRKWADFYFQELADINWLRLPTVPDDYLCSWQSFCLQANPTSPLRAVIEIRMAALFATTSAHVQVHIPFISSNITARLWVVTQRFPWRFRCRSKFHGYPTS